MSYEKINYQKQLADINIKIARDNVLDIENLLALREELKNKELYSLYGYASYIYGNYFIKRANYTKCSEIINDLRTSDINNKKYVIAYSYLMEAVLSWYDGQKWDICFSNCDKILNIIDSATEKDNLLHFLVLLLKGTTYSSQKDELNAYRILWESLHIELDEVDYYNKCKAYQWLGITEMNQGNNEKAVEYLTQSLEIYKANSLIGAYADVICTLGLLNLDFKKIDQAIENFQEALDIAKRCNLVHFVGDAYYNLGMAFEAAEEFGKAEMNYLSSIETFENINDMRGLTNASLMLGSLYTKMKLPENANTTLFQGLALAQQHHSTNHVILIKAYTNLADFYFSVKDYENTLINLKMSEKLCLENNYKIGKQAVYEIFIKYYLEREMYKEAYEYSNLLFTLKLDIQNEQAKKNLELLNMKNETDRLVLEYDQKVEHERIKAVLAMGVTANHEINQPLTVIQFSVELLRADGEINKLSEKQQKNLDKIDNEVKKIFSLLSKYKNSEKFLFDNYLDEKTKLVKFHH
ncbi:MAG: tetratricopeptide repeat protein [Candidatus Cloacimonetes bacterium]|nr:tetratricopeptide repeat protein [Candidatus Cloacimonadota bacterium]